MRRILGRRVASVVAVISVVVAAGPSVPGTVARAAAVPTTAETVASRAGLATGPEILWESDAEQDADYAAVAASGATWTTIDFDWNSIQSDGPGSFRWDAATDRAVLRARAHGLEIIAVAAYVPEWARRADCPPGELHCFPARAADYGRFLGRGRGALRIAFARRSVAELGDGLVLVERAEPPRVLDARARSRQVRRDGEVGVPGGEVRRSGRDGPDRRDLAGARRARRQRVPARDVARRPVPARRRRLLRRRGPPPLLVPHEPARAARLECVHTDPDPLRRDGRPRRCREEDLGHRGGRADGHRGERGVGDGAGGVRPRLLHRVEHDVPVVHGPARHLPVA